MARPAFQLVVRLPKAPRLGGHDARLVLAWSLNELHRALEAWPLEDPPHVVLQPYKEVQP